jgi:hypothetical protein
MVLSSRGLHDTRPEGEIQAIMTTDPLAQQIAQLRNQLTAVDAQLARGSSAPAGLEDLKEAVDNMRTNVWAVLSASRSKDYPEFIARFRLRRAIDILKQVTEEIDQSGRRGALPEFAELQIQMQRAQEAMARSRNPAG